MKFPWFKTASKKTESTNIETKSGGVISPPYFTLAGAFEDSGYYNMAFSMLLLYYRLCAPLADSVDTIADGVSDIQPRLYDKVKREFIENDPVYELLMMPNSDQSFCDFITELSSFDSLCQNSFIEIVGNWNRPPVSMEIRSPAYATLQADRIGDIGRIDIRTNYIVDEYFPEIVERRKRYRTKNGKELWPVLGFNSDKGGSRLFGVPRIQSLYYEIEQYISSGRHNKSLLENGARPAGVFTSKQDTALTDDQWIRMQNEIAKYYGGAGNAGRPLFLEHFEYKNMIMSNRDMDWDKLRNDVKETIYNRYDIPLPVVSGDSMTYSNYSTAQVALYDSAIIPQAKRLFSQIWTAIGYRYKKDWYRYDLALNTSDIDALSLVRMEELKIRKDIGVNTVNELRGKLGDGPIDNGDVILRPANDVPALENDTEQNDAV